MKEQMLNAFKNLVKETKKPLLITFLDQRHVPGNRPSFTEVIDSENYKGKIRKFELDYSQSEQIIAHFNLPKRINSAVIIDKGKQFRTFPGYKNVRYYLRTLSQSN